MRQISKTKSILALLLLVLVFSSFVGSTVQASGIDQNVQVHEGEGYSGQHQVDSIQSGESWVEDDDLYGTDTKKPEEETFEEKDSSFVTKLFLAPLNWIGSFLTHILEQGGITMSNILFGRIDGGGIYLNNNRVNLFGFELKTGNIYGIVAASIYSTIRGVIYVVMIVFIFAKVVKASYTGNGSKALAELKEAVSNCILAFVMLGVMPYFMDLLLYLRDVILKAVAIDGAGKMFELNAGGSITDIFADMRDDNLLNCLMYLASIGLTVYFAFSYVMVAMSFVVSFMAFPFVCVNMQFDKHAMSTWWKNILGYAMVPVVDSALLMIPAFIGKYGGESLSMGFIQILVCFSLIPARAAFRTALGLSSNMGMELAGVGALMMAGRFASGVGKSTVGRISGAMGERKQKKENENLATMEDKLEELETKGNEGPITNPENGKKIESYSSGINPDERKIYEDHATVDNFDSPAMSKNISHATRAKMLRERNRQMYGAHGVKTAIRAVGGIAGGIYGAAAGAGLGGMLSPSISLGLGAAGAMLGGKTGDAIVMGGGAIDAGIRKFRARGQGGDVVQTPNEIVIAQTGQSSVVGGDVVDVGTLVNSPGGTVVMGGDNASSVVYEEPAEVDFPDNIHYGSFMSKGENYEKANTIGREVVRDYFSQEYGGKLDEFYKQVKEKDYEPGKDRYDEFIDLIADDMAPRYSSRMSQEYSRGGFNSTGSVDRDVKAINFSKEEFKKTAKESFHSEDGIETFYNFKYVFPEEYANRMQNKKTE